VIRVILQSVRESAIKLFAATGRIGERFTGREYFQHYGFTSSPLPGAEGILVKRGNHYIMVATDDRRHRIRIDSGEVAIYTDEGDHIHLKRGRIAEIVTETLVIKAATKVRIESPLVEATGEIIDRCESGGKSMAQMRTIYNGHAHGGIEPGGGTTSAPDTGM